MPGNENKNDGITYEGSGVSIDAGEKAVELIRGIVRSTYTDGVVGDIGGFAGFFKGSFPGMKEPLLVSSTDGVGTKVLYAVNSGRLDTVGIDCVAMCVNDIICCGAKPLFFLDYIGCAKNVPGKIARIVDGVAEGCRQSGCALIGGEIAEMPALYSGDDFDLAGFTVGVVDRAKVLDGSAIRGGDVAIGLPSSGIHSNGYSLVRKIIESKGFDTAREIHPLPGLLIDHLLTPTRIYVRTILGLLDKFEIHGVTNITGGGITENLPRIIPDGLRADIDRASWDIPDIFRALQEWGNIGDDEMYRVFNMGIGMILVVPGDSADDVIQYLDSVSSGGKVVGKIISV